MVADPNQNLPLIEVGSEQIAASLRLWLGDAMETESVPAKCAARLGQGFTTTVDATTMALHEVVSSIVQSVWALCFTGQQTTLTIRCL